MATANRTKIHTVYKNAAGKRLPSVTTVLGIINKPALLDWAWKCGKDGLDYKAVRDDAGSVGTLAHYLILCHLRGETPDLHEWAPDQVSRAVNTLVKYADWVTPHRLEPILTEQPLVSETYGYGGTPDCLARLDGELVLLDFKSGKAIYSEMLYQLGAYWQLIWETRRETIDHARILRIGREDTEDFEERRYSMADLTRGWQIFYACLDLYRLLGQK